MNQTPVFSNCLITIVCYNSIHFLFKEKLISHKLEYYYYPVGNFVIAVVEKTVVVDEPVFLYWSLLISPLFSLFIFFLFFFVFFVSLYLLLPYLLNYFFIYLVCFCRKMYFVSREHYWFLFWCNKFFTLPFDKRVCMLIASSLWKENINSYLSKPPEYYIFSTTCG